MKLCLISQSNMSRCFAFQDSQMLSYIEVCLNKAMLRPIDCVNSTAHCDYDKPVQYPPIVHLDGVM